VAIHQAPETRSCGTASTTACLELLETTSIREAASLDLLLEHDPIGKPVSTFPDHARLLLEHDPHAHDAQRAAQTVATPKPLIAGVMPIAFR